jgi:anti-anti-sigma regulatory factor
MGEIVSISGRVAIDTSSRMRDRLADALRSRTDAIPIALSQVDYMDTSRLATLIEAMRLAR